MPLADIDTVARVLSLVSCTMGVFLTITNLLWFFHERRNRQANAKRWQLAAETEADKARRRAEQGKTTDHGPFEE